MKYRLVSAHFSVRILHIVLIIFLLFSHVGAEEQPLYYTIQAGSYPLEDAAVKKYHSLADILASGQHDHLRIEKVGKYHAVRLGRFASRPEAESFFQTVAGPLAGALIMRAYIKPERISLMYSPVKSAGSTALPDMEGTAAQKIPQSREVHTRAAVPQMGAIETGDNGDPADGDVSSPQVILNAAPSLKVNEPDGVNDTIIQNGSFSINYDLADIDDRVSVALYYDADNSGLDGTAIKGSCATAPEGTGATCVWDTTGLAPGIYYVYGLTADNTNQQVSAYASGPLTINAPPSLAVKQPDGANDTIVQQESYIIKYDLVDIDDRVTVAFFYDTDNNGLNGIAITGTCASAPEGTGATCVWDTTGVLPGTYYIYGLTDDGINPKVSSYSSGPVIINAPPVLAVNQPDGEDDTIAENGLYSITYDLADPDDTVSVAFFYDTDNSGFDGTDIGGECSAAAEGSGAKCTWNTTWIAPGTYYVYGRTDDGVNPQVSVYAPGPVSINASPALSVNQPDGVNDTIVLNAPYTINYNLEDIDDTVSGAFFYDTDNSGLDGIAITDACAAAPEGTEATCVWDTTGVEPGIYYVYGIGDDSINPQVSYYSPGPVNINAPPVLAVNQPDGVDDTIAENGSLSITYDLADIDDTVTVTFFYDTDDDGLDGTAIPGACANAPEGTEITCTWDTSGFPAGTYYVYGLTSGDSVNPQVSSYSSGPVIINAPPVLALTQPDGVDDTIGENGLYSIIYDLADPDDTISVAFFYDTENSSFGGTAIDGECAAAAEGSGSSCTWDTTGLAAGTYYVYGLTADSINPPVSAYASGPVTINVAPVLTVNQPDGTDDIIGENGSFTVSYDLADPDDTVSVAFYYDADNQDLNGTAISGSCAVGPEGSGINCTWDTSGVQTGTYYIYGLTDDGINPQVAAYSPGPVTINTPPLLTVNHPARVGDYATAGAQYSISYNLTDPDETVTVAFYFDTNNTGLNGNAIGGACSAAAEGSGAACAWDTTGMMPGTYYIYGIADDGFNPQVSAYSQGQLTIDERYKKNRQPNGMDPVEVVTIIDKNIFGENYTFPYNVHYDPVMDEIYVIGGGGTHPSSRVTIFGSDYFPVASLGAGRGIRSPMGITTSESGDIYIASSGGKQVGESIDEEPQIIILNQAFFITKKILFRDVPKLPKGFQPQKIALGANGNIYANNYNGRGVIVFDADGNFLRWIVPTRDGSLNEEVGDDPENDLALFVTDVEVDKNGRIYIVCFDAGRIFVLDPDEEFLFAFGTKGGSSGKLSQPMDTAIDVERQVIYVADYMRHSINVYDYRDGHFIFEIGGMGYRPGWLFHPTQIAIDRRSNLIIADYFNHRVQVWKVN